MSKIEVEVTLKQKEEVIHFTANAIKQEDVIKFQEPSKTMVKLDIIHDILIRENKEFEMLLSFQREKESYLLLKEYQQKFSLNIKTKQITKRKNNYHIVYERLEDGICSYEIKYKEVDV